MIYECLVEPTLNRIWYSYSFTPDECYATNSTEGWILTVLIALLMITLLQVLLFLLAKSPVSKLFRLIEIQKKINLLIPEVGMENMKNIHWFLLVIFVLTFAFIVFSLVAGIGLFSNYLAGMILNTTGWTLS
tara:strand:- start:392 stop:787 length:396 start_codon:yes stop_codon:yes gene_type:complete